MASTIEAAASTAAEPPISFGDTLGLEGEPSTCEGPTTMAEEENNEAAEQDPNQEAKPAKKNRKAVKLLGGLFALAATGSALAMMAIPAKVDQPRMVGPFEFKFFALIRLIERAVKRDAYGRFEASSATIAPDVAASAAAIGGAAAWFQRYVASSLS